MSTEEERFVAIEIKLAHQEDLVESLNQIVYEQQKRIDKLDALCALLAQHVRNNNADGGPNTSNEKPPHY